MPCHLESFFFQGLRLAIFTIKIQSVFKRLSIKKKTAVNELKNVNEFFFFILLRSTKLMSFIVRIHPCDN